MVINPNVSCKLHPYCLQKTRSPPGPRLPKRIRNTHPCNYHDLKGKAMDVHFSFLSRGVILWIEIPWPENPTNTNARHMWWRSPYTLLMRPNKVERGVQCFRMSCVGVRRIFWLWWFNSQLHLFNYLTLILYLSRYLIGSKTYFE